MNRSLVPLLIVAVAGPVAAQQPRPMPQDTARHVTPRRRESLDENELAVARVDNVPLDPEMRGFVTMPGTGVSFRFGGYAKTDVILDRRPVGQSDLFKTSTIPTGNPVSGEASSFNLHIKQTRFSFELRRASPLGSLRAYFEGDLFGPNGTTAPNLRHAYLQVANVLVGQSFSTFIDLDALPDGVDFEGPNAWTFVLAPQIRYTWPLSRTWSLALAGEQPKSDVTAPAGATPARRFPDIVVRPRLDADWGHFQVALVARDLAYDDGVAGSNATMGWGVQAAGMYQLNPANALFLDGMYGRGIARYSRDFNGYGLDAAPDPGGTLKAIPVYGGYASVQHRWSETLRSNLTGGLLWTDPHSNMAPTTEKQTIYAASSLVFSPRKPLFWGFEVLYGRNETLDGSHGYAWRIQSGLKINLVP